MSLQPKLWTQDILQLIVISCLSLGLSLYHLWVGDLQILTGVRSILGTLQVLFIPGYFIQFIFFPNADDLDDFERIALSIVLSIVIIAPLTYIAEALGLPINATIPVYIHHGLAFVLGAAAYLRRRLLHAAPAYLTIFIPSRMTRTNQQQTRPQSLLMALMGGATVLGCLFVFLMFNTQGAARFDTEFYVLGATDLAESYPQMLVAGEPTEITVAVHNTEGYTHTYYVTISDNFQEGAIVGSSEMFTVADGQTRQLSVLLTPHTPQDDSLFVIQLFRDGDEVAYRRLQLWTTVVAP